MPDELKETAELVHIPQQTLAVPPRIAASQAESRPISSSRRTSKQKPLEKTKKIVWRATALLFWASWIDQLLLSSRVSYSIGAGFTSRTVSLLSSIGFRPVHSENLAKVLKIGWLLTIAGFKPEEFVGLLIYIVLSPLTLLLYLVFKEIRDENASTVTAKVGLRPPKPRRPALTIAGLSFVGWYVLYGEASSRPPLVVGAAISGVLFLLLLGRAFQRVKPLSLSSSSPTSAIDRIAWSALRSIPETLKKIEASGKRSDAVGQIFLYQKARRFYRFLALLMRGQGGKNKLSLLLLVEYILSLSLLGSMAILLWGIATKAALAPSDAALQSFLVTSTAYFLPSMSAPAVPYTVPTWIRIGEAISATLLFVLYVGAAASVLPIRQIFYADRLCEKYKLYRKVALDSKACVSALERLKASFGK